MQVALVYPSMLLPCMLLLLLGMLLLLLLLLLLPHAFDCICRRKPNDRLLMSFDKAGKINTTSDQRTRTHSPPKFSGIWIWIWQCEDMGIWPSQPTGLRFHLVFDWIFNYSLLLVAIYLAAGKGPILSSCIDCFPSSALADGMDSMDGPRFTFPTHQTPIASLNGIFDLLPLFSTSRDICPFSFAFVCLCFAVLIEFSPATDVNIN